MRGRRSLSLPLALAALLGGAASARAESAAEALSRIYPEGAAPKIRFVKGERGNDITYGAEGEIYADKNPKLLRWYWPKKDPIFGYEVSGVEKRKEYTEKSWLALTEEDRILIWEKNKHSGGYLWMKSAEAPAELEDKLAKDMDGRAELITKPFATLEGLLAFQRRVNEYIGVDPSGRSRIYWQANVAFRKRSGGLVAKDRAGIDGYLRATADYAQFGKLHSGYLLHRKDPSFIPAQNLSHSILGPMTSREVKEERTELDHAVAGLTSDYRSHYLQGTYFRTFAYGGERDGFEIRDPHKDIGIFAREARRVTLALENGFDGYAPFYRVTMIDIEAERVTSEKALKVMRETIQTGDWGANAHWKRLLLPMRPYEREYPAALGLGSAETKRFQHAVAEARHEYVATLERLHDDQALSAEEKRKQVLVAVAKFGHDSGLYPLLDRHFAGIGKAQSTPKTSAKTPTRVVPSKTPRAQKTRLDQWGIK